MKQFVRSRHARFVALQIDAERHDAHLALGNAEVAGHELRAVVADGDEAIHMLDMAPDQLQRLRAVRLGQSLEK